MADLEERGLSYKRKELQALVEGKPRPPAMGVLVFTCSGRGRGLFGDADVDSRAMASFVG